MRTIRTLILCLLAVFAIGAVASASASAFNLEWEVCKEGGTEKFETNKCSKTSGTGKWSWGKLEAKETEKVVSNHVAGTQTLLTISGKTLMNCTKVVGKGTITGGKPGTADLTEILFTGCTTSQTGCSVKTAGRKNGEVVWSNIPTKLEERETSTKVKVLADNFEQNATTKEIATYKFEGTCNGFPFTETKLKGTVAAEVKNLSNGAVELNFPSPRLEKDTLEWFGAIVLFTSRDELSLENGRALRAK